MSIITASARPSPLRQMHEQIKQLRIVTAGQGNLYALVKTLEQHYLQTDAGLTRGIVHLHTANQSLHAMLALLLNCPEEQQVNCKQIVTLLEPIRQELQAGFTQMSEAIDVTTPQRGGCGVARAWCLAAQALRTTWCRTTARCAARPGRRTGRCRRRRSTSPPSRRDWRRSAPWRAG